ncbi:MAG: cell wall-binding repeat-containing protein [Actinomycetaceae bacterium]|nr:cell wall-binding repeat-containing protein [Actinomycetaceae bacterium]
MGGRAGFVSRVGLVLTSLVVVLGLVWGSGFGVVSAFGADSVSRIAGADRFETASRIAMSVPGGASTVFVAVGEDFADALAAGPIAAASSGATVLTSRGQGLSPHAKVALQHLKPQSVVVVGGTAAIPESTLAEISSVVPSGKVSRIGGANRYATAVGLANMAPNKSRVFIASGANFPDALAGGVVAGKNGNPVLLTDSHVIPGETLNAVKAMNPSEVVFLGGNAAIDNRLWFEVSTALPNSLVRGISGVDRYDTALQVMKDSVGWGAGYAGNVVYASATSFPDALAGVAFAARSNAPLVLVGKNANPYPRNNPGWVLGGSAVVEDGAWAKTPQAPAVPAGQASGGELNKWYKNEAGQWVCTPAEGRWDPVKKKLILFCNGISDPDDGGRSIDSLGSGSSGTGSGGVSNPTMSKQEAWQKAKELRAANGIETLETCNGLFTNHNQPYGGSPEGDGSIWMTHWDPERFKDSPAHWARLMDKNSNFIIVKHETLDESHGSNYVDKFNPSVSGVRNQVGLAIMRGTCEPGKGLPVNKTNYRPWEYILNPSAY